METAADVLKQALFNEVKASAFFARASEITSNDASRMLLLDLAGMEDDHLRDLIVKSENAPCAQEFNPEAYLKDLERSADSMISEDDLAAFQSGDMKMVLESAIRMERESRDTYLKLQEKAVDPDMKQYCDMLIQEETAHEQSLTRLLNSLDMEMDERPGL